MHDIVELEKQGWKALSTSKEAATEFYESLLIDDAIMAFPGGMMLVGKNQILESINSQPWESFDIAGLQELSLSDDALPFARDNGGCPFIIKR
ncbi:hypothetical protein IQ241_11010 [Romeria aff. gracilis LEGE 07310]|uniref:Uncharacterized protein n=1 Tax=Vasconcelosia minhoensis LEGE 07310 TaxID=915328 RepID=A0A8J7ACU1_9CYAN|nr:hypothetical protein [Romeria gracilis]MBE9077816.1 hypothetical protein [Romeria aff. gracilis LEGE 07310]